MKIRKKIESHWKLLVKLWKSFESVSTHATSVGAQVFHEWPRSCAYWSNSKVETFLRRKGFQFVEVDGCMYNVRATAGAHAGVLIKKPWRIAYSPVSCKLELLTCSRDHVHTPCAGRSTQSTENYTVEFARSIADQISSFERSGPVGGLQNVGVCIASSISLASNSSPSFLRPRCASW